MHKKSTVFQKFVFSYVLLLLSSVLMISGIAYYKTYSIVYRNIQSTNLASIERLKDQMQTVFEETDSLALSLQGWPAINKIFTMNETLNSSWVSNDELFNLVYVLRKHRVLHSYIDNIAIIFRDVNLVVDCNSSASSYDEFFNYRFSFDSEDFHGIDDLNFTLDNRLIAGCMVGKYTQPNQERLLYFKAIPNAAGTNKAMLMITMIPENLIQILDETMIFDEGMWMIRDSEERTILVSSPLPAPTSFPVSSVKNQQTGYFMWQGELYTYYYLSSPFLKQQFYTFYPLDKIIRHFINIIPFILLSLVIVFGIGLILAFYYARKNYAPIRKLVILSPSAPPGQSVMDEFSFIAASLQNLADENDGLRKSLESYMPVIRNNLLNRLMLSSGLTEDDRHELTKYNIVFPESFFLVCSIFIEAINVHSEETLDDSPVSSVIFISYIEEYLKDMKLNLYLTEMYSGDYCLLINCSSAQIDAIKTLFIGLGPFLRKKMSSDVDIDLRMGISSIAEDDINFKQLYYQAVHAADHNYNNHLGKKGNEFPQIIWYDELEQHKKISYNFTFNDEIKLMNLIKSGQKQEALAFADTVLDDFFSQGRIRREDAFYIYNQLLFICAKVVHETHIRVSDIVDFQKLMSLPLFTQMNEYTMTCISNTCDTILSVRDNSDHNLSERVVQYIRENFKDNDLSLTCLADHFHVTAIYISKSVKKISGISFIDYLNRLRIDQSKQLLSSTDRSVRDISSEVGYDSDKNFIRVFKKYEGITPGQYRKNTSKTV